MARTCTICRSPKRPAINKALIAGATIRDIAAQFKLSASSVERHKADHLPAAVRRGALASGVAEDSSLVEQLRALHAETREVLVSARLIDDSDTMLRAIARLERQLELQARLVGDLSDAPQVAVLLSPDWLVVRTVIMTSLEDHPAARVAVSDALSLLELPSLNLPAVS